MILYSFYHSDNKNTLYDKQLDCKKKKLTTEESEHTEHLIKDLGISPILYKLLVQRAYTQWKKQKLFPTSIKSATTLSYSTTWTKTVARLNKTMRRKKKS